MAIKYEDKGCITDGAFKLNHRDKFIKWLSDNEGLFFSVAFKILGKSKCRKTREQLGYYWAALVPLITEELVHLGWTKDVYSKKEKELMRKMDEYHSPEELEILFEKQRVYDEGDTHEFLTECCGHVGENGKHLRLSDSEMTLERMIQFISNVLDVAIIHLSMNAEALKAKRPKL